MSARDGGVFAELQRQRRAEHGEARGELARGPGGGGRAERDVGGAERGKELSEGREAARGGVETETVSLSLSRSFEALPPPLAGPRRKPPMLHDSIHPRVEACMVHEA